MPEETVEKLDQEITLQLQKIDSNLSYCFSKITKEIIPHVTQYGDVCEDIMDNASWLVTMFQQTGNVDLNLNPQEPLGSESDKKKEVNNKDVGGKNVSPETLFPLSGGRTGGDSSSEVFMVPTLRANTSTAEDEFRTANITTTGQILRLPSDSSDEEDHSRLRKSGKHESLDADAEADADGSTLQRQRRKRKVSLLLQQEYGSSSSMIPSPVALTKNDNHKEKTSTNDDDRHHRTTRSSALDEETQDGAVMDSSPIKNDNESREREDESTKEVPKPGTVIHFSTGL